MGQPVGSTVGWLTAFDGLRLHFEQHHAEEPARAALVFAHGYSDHAGGTLRDLAQRLTPFGYEVLVFDFRGHGRSDGQRGHVNHFSDYLADLEAALSHMRRSAPAFPLGIVAQSHGGLIALRMLVDKQPVAADLRGVALASPFLGIALPAPRYKTTLARLISDVVPSFSLPNGLKAEETTRNAEKAREFMADPLVHHVATARWYVEATAAQAYVAAHADCIDVPTLWLIGGDDRVALPSTSRQVFQKARGDKQLIEYDGFYHELFNEPGGDRVFRDLLAWLNAKIAGTQAVELRALTTDQS